MFLSEYDIISFFSSFKVVKQFFNVRLGKVFWAGNFRMDTFNPDCLIRISNMDTFNFLLNPLFFGYSNRKSKPVFSKLEISPPVSVQYSSMARKFQISRLMIRDSDWLNFIQFSQYKYKFRLVSRLRKIGSSTDLDISTISKVPSSGCTLKIQDFGRNNFISF